MAEEISKVPVNITEYGFNDGGVGIQVEDGSVFRGYDAQDVEKVVKAFLDSGLDATTAVENMTGEEDAEDDGGMMLYDIVTKHWNLSPLSTIFVDDVFDYCNEHNVSADDLCAMLYPFTKGRGEETKAWGEGYVNEEDIPRVIDLLNQIDSLVTY
jgi:hypothetical protein